MERMFDGRFEFIDSMSTIGDGVSVIPSPTQGVQKSAIGDDYSDDVLQAKYTPEELKIAINTGQVDYNKLSTEMKDMVDNVDLEETPVP